MANTRKDDYRVYFKKVSPYVRFQAILRENDIDVLQPNFSKFIGGCDAAVSEQNLKKIKKACTKLGKDLHK